MTDKDKVDLSTDDSHEDLFNEMFAGGDTVDEADLAEDEDEIVINKEADDSAQEAETSESSDGKPVIDPETEVKPVRPVVNDPYAWINTVPEEYKDNVNRLKHEALSDRGRVSALSRKLNEMQAALDAMKSRATVADKGNTSPSKPTAQEPPDSLRQLKEDYPELGRQLDEIFAYERSQAETLIDSRLQPLQEKLSASAKEAEEVYLDREAAKLFNTEETGVHWKDIVKSDDFNAWVEMQPSFVQSTARSTNSASEALEILRMYENDYQRALASTQRPAPVTDTKPDEDAKHGDHIKASREKRKASTLSPSSRPAGTSSEEFAGDHEAMFNAMWSKKNQSRR